MLETGLYVVICYRFDYMRNGKKRMRVHSTYGPWPGQAAATMWALRNIAPKAEWTVEPVLDPAAAPT